VDGMGVGHSSPRVTVSWKHVEQIPEVRGGSWRWNSLDYWRAAVANDGLSSPSIYHTPILT
jgi:hypothetical protein